MKNFKNLFSIASDSTRENIDIIDIPRALLSLYQIKNGCYLFEESLRIFNTGEIIEMSKFSTILNLDLFIFGENCLGDFFGTKNDIFYRFDIELGKLEFLGKNIDSFSKEILDNYNYYSGYSLYKNWSKINGKLNTTEILMPKIPFVLGGAYDENNLFSLNKFKAYLIKINFLKEISTIKNGDKIDLSQIYKIPNRI